jgi:hypothetical protein
MYQSTELPEIKILPTEKLLPHENCDPRRVEKLSQRLLEEGLLKNPPVIANIPNSDLFVVLDGANRVTTFKTLGIPHIVAQLVNYGNPGVSLDTWYHVVSGMERDFFWDSIQELEGIRTEVSTLEEAREKIKTGAIEIYFVDDNGIHVVISEEDLLKLDKVSLLNRIVDIYRGKSDIFRASNDIWEIQKPFYPEITSLIIFPRLEPVNIMEAARSTEKIPSGITRHIIPARALNINIPIGILMADWSFDKKKLWMDEWMMERMSANAIRYYAESTFSFNE